MPPVMGGERDGKRRRRQKGRASRRKNERVEREPKGEMERLRQRRRRRWMLINYKPSGSKSSSFKCGVGAAESHGGSY